MQQYYTLNIAEQENKAALATFLGKFTKGRILVCWRMDTNIQQIATVLESAATGDNQVVVSVPRMIAFQLWQKLPAPTDGSTFRDPFWVAPSDVAALMVPPPVTPPSPSPAT